MTRRKARHVGVATLATHWGVSHKTVLKLIAAQSLHAHRVGRVWRVAPEEVRRYEREQGAPKGVR